MKELSHLSYPNLWNSILAGHWISSRIYRYAHYQNKTYRRKNYVNNKSYIYSKFKLRGIWTILL